jgi:hypothetical protein
LFDFFNGTAGVDVDFTHPVILQGNLPFDRDDECIESAASGRGRRAAGRGRSHEAGRPLTHATRARTLAVSRCGAHVTTYRTKPGQPHD